MVSLAFLQCLVSKSKLHSCNFYLSLLFFTNELELTSKARDN